MFNEHYIEAEDLGEAKGAGRRPNAARQTFRTFAGRVRGTAPRHVTMRLLSGVGFLRAFSRARAIEDALRAVKERFGLRVVHYSIQGNHPAPDRRMRRADCALARHSGSAVRLARALNASRGGREGVLGPLSRARPEDDARGRERGPVRARELPVSLA